MERDVLKKEMSKLLDEKFAPVFSEIANLKSKVESMEETLEQKTYASLKMVAEDHLSLTKKLDEVGLTASGKVRLLVQINNLESDLKKAKEELLRADGPVI